MILFLEDWQKYPSATVDVNTKNTSWVRLAGLLKHMGIKNHAFPLALHNKELVGLDPFSPNLTKFQILSIIQEATENPWYFFREIATLSAQGADRQHILANRMNISLWWLFFNHITSLTIIGRQQGKSVSLFSLTAYLLTNGAINTDIHLLTKDDDLRVKSVADVKNILEDLPWYFNLKTRHDAYNTERITIGSLGNTLHTSVAQASTKSAANIGRGLTVSIHIVDEFNFIKNNEITIPGLLASSSAARDSAKKAGGYYGNIFASTAGYLSSQEGKFGYKIYNQAMRWNETLYDCKNEEELALTVKRNSPSGSNMVVCEYNHKQMGKTDEWIREKIRDAMADGERAEAEFLNIWSRGNEESPISKEMLEIIYGSIIPDPRTEISPQAYITNWYLPEEIVMKRKLVAGLDTSDAIGNDDIAMCIRDAYSGEVVATGLFNETNILTFSEYLVDLLEKYDNIACMIIERKSTGSSIIDNLIKLLPLRNIDPFRKLFNWVVNDAQENRNFIEEVVSKSLYNRKEEAYTKYKKHFGYATSSSGRSSRDNLYGAAFNSSVKYTGKFVRDKTLASQLGGLVKKNGRIDHQADGHDDMVISWMLSHWLLTQGKNLSYYGLDTKLVLSSISNSIIAEQGGMNTIIEKQNQSKVLDNIYELLDKVKQEPNPMIATNLVNRIKQLSTYLDDSLKVNFNLESILDEIKLKKKRIFRY